MTTNARSVRTRGLAATVLVGLAVAACRGGVSNQPPVHLVLDMDVQPKVKAQGESEFFANQMGMRLPVPGTVARGSLRSGPLYHYKDVGANNAVTWVTGNPVEATPEVMARGRERYNINCAPCHDQTGSGDGLVGRRWPVKVASFYDPERLDMPPGRVVGAITDGFGTMPSYAHQVSWTDRWAIAHYVHALQYRMKAPKN
jgi:mono/diheme cytochrome c family protein